MAEENYNNVENDGKTEHMTGVTKMTLFPTCIFSKKGAEIFALGIRNFDNSVSIRLIVKKSSQLLTTIDLKRTELSTATQVLMNYKLGIKADDIAKINREISSKYNELTVISAIKGVGWQFADNEQVIGFANVKHLDLQGNELPTYSTRKNSKNGDYSMVHKSLKEYFAGNTKRQALFCIALSSVICGLIRQNLVTVLAGNSSCGKTTLTKLFISAFANPNNSRFVTTFNATENFLVQSLTDNNGIPTLIDDTSLTKQKNLDAFLYQLINGIERGRLTNEGDISMQRTWATSTFITSEKSVLFSGDVQLKGKVGRILEIHVSGDELFNNAEQAEEMQALYRENYGLLETAYIRSLLTNAVSVNIHTLINEEIREIRAISQSDDELVNRLEEKIALVSLTSKLVNETFDFGFSCDNIRDYMIEICKENVKMYREICENVMDFPQAYSRILKSAVDKAVTKTDRFAVVKSDDFKTLFHDFSSSIGASTLKDFKALLKQNDCLFVNSGDYGYRTADLRGYALIIKEEGVKND